MNIAVKGPDLGGSEIIFWKNMDIAVKGSDLGVLSLFWKHEYCGKGARLGGFEIIFWKHDYCGKCMKCRCCRFSDIQKLIYKIPNV